jgi:hypothetical protein
MSRGRIVGSGTIPELLVAGGVLPTVHVELALTGGQTAAEVAEALAALPQVESVDPTRGAGDASFAVCGSDRAAAEGAGDAEPLEAAIGRLAHERGYVVTTLSRRAGDLEDAFIALTRGEDQRASAEAVA